MSKPSIGEASLALSELLTSLASGGSSESDLISKLAKSHSEASVHRALRAALSQRLIAQEVGLGRSFREIFAVFSPRMEARLRRQCQISLSQAGAIWAKDSDVSTFGKGSGKAAEHKTIPRTINAFFIGDSTFHTVVSAQGGAASGDGQPQGAKAPEESPAVTESQTAKATSDSSDGLTVAWSAGVSATGAGLAALVPAGDASWQLALFISLVFVSGCAFVILICVGLPNMMSWWRGRRRTHPAEHGTE